MNYFTFRHPPLKNQYGNLVAAIVYYCHEKPDEFESVIKHYESKLKIQNGFGLCPIHGKQLFQMPETEKEAELTKRGDMMRLYGKNALSLMEVDPIEMQRRFGVENCKPATPQEAMKAIVKRIKSGINGEKFYKNSFVVKQTENLTIRGCQNQESKSEEESVEKVADESNANMSDLKYD